ncbi:MAG TPA: hypothetical protein VEC36_13375 [Patescibacteria group bacterium]|nr:hypothetical protein [Patescibacteria group bacterium]
MREGLPTKQSQIPLIASFHICACHVAQKPLLAMTTIFKSFLRFKTPHRNLRF